MPNSSPHRSQLNSSTTQLNSTQLKLNSKTSSTQLNSNSTPGRVQLNSTQTSTQLNSNFNSTQNSIHLPSPYFFICFFHEICPIYLKCDFSVLCWPFWIKFEYASRARMCFQMNAHRNRNGSYARFTPRSILTPWKRNGAPFFFLYSIISRPVTIVIPRSIWG